MQQEKCQDCGKEKDDVRERACPFAEEIRDEIVMVVICDDCCHERFLDT